MNAHFNILSWYAAIALSQAAFAQDAALTAGSLPQVVVREAAIPAILRAGDLATGSDASTMDTPFSAKSMPVEVLRSRGGATLQDALRNVRRVQADSGFNGVLFLTRNPRATRGSGTCCG